MNKLAQKAKAIAALVGATATALLGVYGPDTQVGHILTIVVGVATAVKDATKIEVLFESGPKLLAHGR